MIRVIIKTVETDFVLYGGAQKAKETYKTIKVDSPEIEKELRGDNKNVYKYNEIVGIELINNEDSKAD